MMKSMVQVFGYCWVNGDISEVSHGCGELGIEGFLSVHSIQNWSYIYRRG